MPLDHRNLSQMRQSSDSECFTFAKKILVSFVLFSIVHVICSDEQEWWKAELSPCTLVILTIIVQSSSDGGVTSLNISRCERSLQHLTVAPEFFGPLQDCYLLSVGVIFVGPSPVVHLLYCGLESKPFKEASGTFTSLMKTNISTHFSSVHDSPSRTCCEHHAAHLKTPDSDFSFKYIISINKKVTFFW